MDFLLPQQRGLRIPFWGNGNGFAARAAIRLQQCIDALIQVNGFGFLQQVRSDAAL
jgi:hypothetical protein